MSDLALGVVVFVFLAVPASLLLLVLADVIRLEGDGARRRWVRLCLWALAVPASVPVGIAAWGAAGAAHLEPLCQAYATPEFRASRPIEATAVLLNASSTGPTQTAADSVPAWAGHFGRDGLPRLIVDPTDAIAATTTLALEVRRVTHHRNLWFEVTMERFRLIDRRWGAVLAEGDELWVDAGRARHHCGIVSGTTVVSSERSPWPGGAGVARFVGRGLRPAPLNP